MKSIFENACFGKAYKTRDGRKAIYLYKRADEDLWHDVIVEHSGHLFYEIDGKYSFDKREHPLDIIGEWKGPINEEELDKLANDYEEEYTKEDYEAIRGILDYEWGAEINGKTEGFIDGFKAGYKLAKSE